MPIMTTMMQTLRPTQPPQPKPPALPSPPPAVVAGAPTINYLDLQSYLDSSEDEEYEDLIAQYAPSQDQIQSSSSSLPTSLVADDTLGAHQCDDCGRYILEAVFCGECSMAYCLPCDAQYHALDEDTRQHFRQTLPIGHDQRPQRRQQRERVAAMRQAVQAVPSVAFHPAITRDPYSAEVTPREETKVSPRKAYMYRRPQSAGAVRPILSSSQPTTNVANHGRAGRLASSVISASTATLTHVPQPPPPPPSQLASSQPPARPVRPMSAHTRPVSARSSRPTSARRRPNSRPASARVRPTSTMTNDPSSSPLPLPSTPSFPVPQSTIDIIYGVAPLSSNNSTSNSASATPLPTSRPSTARTRPSSASSTSSAFLSRSHPLSQTFHVVTSSPKSRPIALTPGPAEVGAHTAPPSRWGAKTTPGELVAYSEQIRALKLQITQLELDVHQAKISVMKKQHAVHRFEKTKQEILRTIDPQSKDKSPRSRSQTRQPIFTGKNHPIKVLRPKKPLPPQPSPRSKSKVDDDGKEIVDPHRITQAQLEAIQAENEQLRLEMSGLNEYILAMKTARSETESTKIQLTELKVQHETAMKENGQLQASHEISTLKNQELVMDLEYSLDQMQQQLQGKKRQQEAKVQETNQMRLETEAMRKEYTELQRRLDKAVAVEQMQVQAERIG